jgi:hypothetical protein
MPREQSTIPLGLCQCGCGQLTKISNHDYKERGHVKGQPVRYVKGHHRKSGPLYIEDPVSGCCNWVRAHSLLGYGIIRRDRRSRPAHRLIYEQYCGAIPEGMELDHLCRNPSCVNPSHLEPVTHANNIRRGKRTKLREWQVREIRSLLSSMNDRALAERYGVSKECIASIRHGRSWKGI